MHTYKIIYHNVFSSFGETFFDEREMGWLGKPENFGNKKVGEILLLKYEYWVTTFNI